MKFNTTSYIAGVGSVVVVLSTGFVGGYFLANPAPINPPNRLQRLAAEDHTAPAPTAPKPEAVAAVTPAAAAAPASPTAEPAKVTAPATSAAQPPVQQPATQQAAVKPPVSPADVKAVEPARTVAVQETTAPVADKADTDKADTQKVSADKERTAEAKFVERKRGEARKVAEQQRKQRELEVATVAVRRIIHDRDAPDVVIHDRDAPELVENDPPQVPAPAMPHFNLFGQ